MHASLTDRPVQGMYAFDRVTGMLAACMHTKRRFAVKNNQGGQLMMCLS
jgi:hypothetical protein